MSADTFPRPVVSARRAARRISLVYFVFGLLWILFSDAILGHFQANLDVLVNVAMVKGCAFVLVTAALLYVLVYRRTAALERSHHQVAASEHQLRRLIETASEGIVIVTPDDETKITFVNERLAHALGYGVTELVGRSMLDVVDEQWREAAREHCRQRHHGQGSHYDMKLRHRDGRAVWVIASVNPLFDEDGRHVASLGMLTDVTERMRTQRELDQFFSLSLEMLCIAGFDGYFKKVNPRTEQVLGYSGEELLARPVIEFVHPEDVADAQQQMDRLKKGEPVHRFELRARRSDGTYCWLNVYAVPSLEEQLIYVAARDTTEHRQAVEALRKSEATLKSVLAAAPIGIGVLTDRTIGLTNTYVDQVSGYTSAELLNQSSRLFYESDEEFERVGREKWAQLQKGPVGAIETHWRHKAGHIIDVLLSFAATDPANPGAEVVFTATDITERNRSERALRESESRFRSIFEQCPIGIGVYDSDGALLEANAACREIFGLADFAQARGSRMYDDPHLPEEAARRLRAGETVHFESHYDFAQIRAKNLYATARTELADLDIILSPLRTNPGAPTHGYLLLVQDFSTRKRLEEQLRHAQKMEAIGQLAGGVSHDFNNILTAIFGNVELMRAALGHPGAGEEGLREGLDQIERSGQRAAALTRQLLTFSRRQVVKPEILSPSTILIDMEKMLRRLLPENVELHLAGGRDTWHVRADAGQLEQVFLNLVVNARDAMPKGGTLTVDVANRTLDPTATDLPSGACPGPYVVLTVGDTGCGMDEKTLARIFDPFFTTKPLGQGTGLGLATVDAIVRRFDGHIRVSSKTGSGSVFEVFLPAITDVGIATACEDAAKAVGDRETILVCEDDSVVRNLICRALVDAGYTVLEASAGQEALDLIAGHAGPIHLLATDIVMPGMSGRELAQTLLACRPDLKVLFVSGYAADALADIGRSGSEIDFLAKPFSSPTLLQHVRRVLDRKPAARPT